MFDDILAQFPLPPVLSVMPVGRGLVNVTYNVSTEQGDFVLQKLHNVIPDAAADDMQAVTSFLAAHGMAVPSLVSTKSGAPFARHIDGTRWRVYPWIAGKVVNAIENANMAHEAGRLVGKMHALLRTFDYTPKGSISHFHDTDFILAELRSEYVRLSPDISTIADDILATLPDIILNDGTRHVIHGDLKISNILFDDNGHAIGAIDFDTLLLHYPEIDLGDALRSWCNTTSEDDANATFDMTMFNAVEEGYAEGLGEKPTPEARMRHLRAAKHITLELAARFLIDVVRDNYFGYDAEKYASRRDANIARAVGQHHLASTIPLA